MAFELLAGVIAQATCALSNAAESNRSDDRQKTGSGTLRAYSSTFNCKILFHWPFLKRSAAGDRLLCGLGDARVNSGRISFAVHRDCAVDRSVGGAAHAVIRLRRVPCQAVEVRDCAPVSSLGEPYSKTAVYAIVWMKLVPIHLKVIRGIPEKGDLSATELEPPGAKGSPSQRRSGCSPSDLAARSPRSTRRRFHLGAMPADHRSVGFPLQRVKIFVGEECRLANALRVEKPESPLKRSRRRSGFLEQVGVGPVAHTLHQSLAGFELGQDIGRTDVGIMHGIARSIAGAPLGKKQWKPWKW